MRLLIEEGGAFISVTDRWGNTPLHEAKRAGAQPCAAYLERCIAQQRGRADHIVSFMLPFNAVWTLSCRLLPLQRHAWRTT